MRGLRLVRLPVLFPRLVQIVLQQLVSFQDACHGWRRLVYRYGRTVSGHHDLRAPPTAKELARLPSHAYVECGILPQHGRRIHGLTRFAKRIETVWGGGLDDGAIDRTSQMLAQLRGIGPWTVGYLRGSSMGDADAAVVGDYGFPSRVAYFFSGEEKSNDDQMLRLLDPFSAVSLLRALADSQRRPNRHLAAARVCACCVTGCCQQNTNVDRVWNLVDAVVRLSTGT